MKAKVKIIIAMLIFSSLGVFVRKINLSPSKIALARSLIGTIFLYAVSIFTGQKMSWEHIRKNIVLLLMSGAAMGFNWIFLFQAYKYTTISNATLSYYFAPVFIMLLSPMVLKEKLTARKLACIFGAMFGLILIVDIGGGKTPGGDSSFIGVAYGLLAALLYASVVLINKFIKNLKGLETTLMQLFIAALILAPYVLLTENFNFANFSTEYLPYILILGIVHTGIAYLLYFTALKELEGQTIAILSYIDPIFAVIISSTFLGESMSGIQIIGGILILGSAFLSEGIGLRRLENKESLNEV